MTDNNGCIITFVGFSPEKTVQYDYTYLKCLQNNFLHYFGHNEIFFGQSQILCGHIFKPDYWSVQ